MYASTGRDSKACLLTATCSVFQEQKKVSFSAIWVEIFEEASVPHAIKTTHYVKDHYASVQVVVKGLMSALCEKYVQVRDSLARYELKLLFREDQSNENVETTSK